MAKKIVTSKTHKEKETEEGAPEIVRENASETNLDFWTTQKILFGASVAACLGFLLIVFFLWGTVKPTPLAPSLATEIPALSARLAHVEKTVAQHADGRPSSSSPAVWIAFSLLRQDILAGIPPAAGVARLRAVLPNAKLQALEETLGSLSQERVWSLGELILKFDASVFFQRQEKKVGFLGKSLAFLERFFTIWKTTPPQGRENGEGPIHLLCAQVKAGDIKGAVRSAEEFKTFLGAEGQFWFQEAQRFVRAQEILITLENAFLA